MDYFIKECQNKQPNLSTDLERFIDGIIALPIEKEFLLQAYAIRNFERMFGVSSFPILYERPLPDDRPDMDKMDIIFLAENGHLFVMETKYLDQVPGSTARSRRNRHRNKVHEQILRAKGALSDQWNIGPDAVSFVIFTNDMALLLRPPTNIYEIRTISSDALELWRLSIYTENWPAKSISE